MPSWRGFVTDRRWLAALLGSALLLAVLSPVRAQVPGLSARFREEKQIALLAAPLVNEGMLYFAPPGRLVRHTERPAPSTLLLDGGRLTVGEGNRVRTLEVAESPAVAVFVEGFVHLLSGDRARLEADFALTFEAE